MASGTDLTNQLLPRPSSCFPYTSNHMTPGLPDVGRQCVGEERKLGALPTLPAHLPIIQDAISYVRWQRQRCESCRPR